MSDSEIKCYGTNGLHQSHKLGMGLENTCQNCSAFNSQYDYETIELAAEMRGQIRLDPEDPFDNVLIDIVNMNRKKRRDYAGDDDPFSNFRDSASNLGMEGFGPAESAYVLLLTKVARLNSLRKNGRMEDPSNESVMDTYLDLAVYAVILLALVKEK